MPKTHCRKILIKNLDLSKIVVVFPHKHQTIELSSSSENENIIQEGELFFKKKPTIGLPEVSKLIESLMSKRQGDQRKHSFLQKKNIP